MTRVLKVICTSSFTRSVTRASLPTFRVRYGGSLTSLKRLRLDQILMLGLRIGGGSGCRMGTDPVELLPPENMLLKKSLTLFNNSRRRGLLRWSSRPFALA